MAVRAGMMLAGLILATAPGSAGCPAGGDQPARVAAVGPRLEIQLSDGRAARLAGLDLPDETRGEPQTGEEARAFLSRLLIGKTIALAPFALRLDRWDRLPADVFVARAEGAPPQSAALAMLDAGFARVRPEAETRDCRVSRLAAELSARERGLGLWTDPYYAVVEAGDSEDLQGRDGLFAIVEGVVTRVGVGRSRYYLDFGRRGAFTATIPKRLEKQFVRAGMAPVGLTGQALRVRGVLDNRFALRMEVGDPQQIERLADEKSKEALTPK